MLLCVAVARTPAFHDSSFIIECLKFRARSHSSLYTIEIEVHIYEFIESCFCFVNSRVHIIFNGDGN